jgi:3-methyladenine DNA glycosylase AlkD
MVERRPLEMLVSMRPGSGKTTMERTPGQRLRYARTLALAVTDAFAPHRDASRAAAMSAYMRDQFPFLGIPAPRRDAVSKQVIAAIPPADEESLLSAARACWDLEEREYQYFGVRLLRQHVGLMTPASIPTYERLTTTKPWWDTVDELSSHIAGPLVAAYPELRSTTDTWISHPDFWLARTAILHQLGYKSTTDADVLFRYCLTRGSDKEFFIRKAIGWALREYSKTDPAAVLSFVDAHSEALSPLSKREATRRIGR